MTGLESLGVVTLGLVGLARLAHYLQGELGEYKLARECPHPEHRVYTVQGSFGEWIIYCDECSYTLDKRS